MSGRTSGGGHHRRGWARHAVLIGLAIVLLLTIAPFLVVALNAVKTPADYATRGPIALPRSLNLAGVVEF
ncbi:MAG TPA: hypothetical protein VK601_09430, partial [Kofleriaceae bacterium]|nr:hypothetical protein [Kofleriaceae bacterium]